jgi:hypothetical protein
LTAFAGCGLTQRTFKAQARFVVSPPPGWRVNPQGGKEGDLKMKLHVTKKQLIIVAIAALMLPCTVFAQEPTSLTSVGGTADVHKPDGETQQSSCATGTILVDQQPNQVNGIFNDSGCDLCGGGQSLAEDFILQGRQPIGKIILWGGYYSTDTPLPQDDWTVIFHQDAAGLPDAVISTEANVPAPGILPASYYSE